jgi:hypothetical protein
MIVRIASFASLYVQYGLVFHDISYYDTASYVYCMSVSGLDRYYVLLFGLTTISQVILIPRCFILF